jgi:N-acetylmuramoyl-L-alanine amidase
MRQLHAFKLRKSTLSLQSATAVLRSVLLFSTVFLVGWALTPSLVAISYTKPVPLEEPKGMRDWKFIVIHHSGAMVGNEKIIEMGHLQRGMENGMAYHFLIGNGSAGLKDGQVVEGRRWKYQIQGGHSHQDLLNEKGIGICLVGNFSRKLPSDSQLKALSELILKLQAEFGIPDEKIHGHGHYLGEESDCPGKIFPWQTLWASLDNVFTNMELARLEKEKAQQAQQNLVKSETPSGLVPETK